MITVKLTLKKWDAVFNGVRVPMNEELWGECLEHHFKSPVMFLNEDGDMRWVCEGTFCHEGILIVGDTYDELVAQINDQGSVEVIGDLL
mgnify:CR=1 FL=1